MPAPNPTESVPDASDPGLVATAPMSEAEPIVTPTTADASELEVSSLTWKVIDGEATQEDVARLDHLIAVQAEAKESFLRTLGFDHELRLIFDADPRVCKPR